MARTVPPDVLDVFLSPRVSEDLESSYRLHAGVCLALARRLLQDSHHAEDAVQEAFLELWSHPDRRDETRSSTRSWLLMLTHRRAVDRIRREERRRSDPLGPDQDWADERPDTQLLAIGSIQGAALVPLLVLLSAVQREAVVLTYWGGHSQQEVAALTGVPHGTVKSRVRSGVAHLRVLMGEPVRAT